MLYPSTNKEKSISMMLPKDQFRHLVSIGDSALVVIGFGLALSSCVGDGAADGALWGGSVDTLPNGTIEVHNPSYGIWDSTTAWHVVEELRIGTLEGSGPDLFGNISTFEVDESGNIYVFESQAQELRVFNASGQYIRTIGREGGGPGEFRQGIGLAWAPDGLLWVVDPGNSRISAFDTTGAYVTMKRILGGYVMMPWPGRFDRAGSFYHYGMDIEAERGGRFVMVRFDTLLNPLDTIRVPRPPDDRYFELHSETGSVTAGIPFTASITSRIGPNGNLWFANTGNYHIYKRSVEGDTSLKISREFEPLPVSAEEIDSAVARLEWFTRQGGRVDRSRFPSVKPVLRSLYLDDEGRVWVEPIAESHESGSPIDVFDVDGRYLGRMHLPFRLGSIPRFRHGNIYAVTFDEVGVPYVVRGRIEKP
jgi:hypothetical protein